MDKIVIKIRIENILKNIDWNIFLSTLKVKGSSEEKIVLDEANRILKDWSNKNIMIKAVYKNCKVRKDNDFLDIAELKIPLVRNQGLVNESLADYFEENDYLGFFIASIKPEDEKDIFQQLLANVLIEASSEYLQNYISENNWNINIRPAIGYPSLPDHSLKKDIFNLLNAESIGVELSENFAMKPTSTVCGIYIGNPKSEYLSPRTILDDQLEDISKIRGITPSILKKYMGM